MKKEMDRDRTTEKKAQGSERPRFDVKEPSTTSSLVVSEFDRAPLTDVNFGF